MTIARWKFPGRALASALLLLVLASPAPAPAAPGPAAPAHVSLPEARADHVNMALRPLRRLQAQRRAERDALLQESLAPVAAAEAKPEPKAKAKAETKAKPKAKADAKPKAEKGPDGKTVPPLASSYGEEKALDLPSDVQVGQARTEGAGGSLGRTLFGLMIVVALIYGLTLLLRRMRNGSIGVGGRSQGLKAVASIPLGPNRSIHLVRAGQEYLLVGAAEHGVVPLRTYSEDEARAAGLLDLDAGVAAAAVKKVATPLAAVGGPRKSPWGGKIDAASIVDTLRAKTVRR